MNNAQLINQNSGRTDYRTPAFVVSAARKVMGEIDLDPASSPDANRLVRASRYYCEPGKRFSPARLIGGLPVMLRDGRGAFDERWVAGSVWMNHPFGTSESKCVEGCAKKACQMRGYHIGWDQEGNAEWISKLVLSYKAGLFGQSCNITFAATSEAWFQPLARYPQCFLCPRTNYTLPDGTPLPGVTKGSVVTYLGRRVARFAACFEKFGEIKVSLKPARRRK